MSPLGDVDDWYLELVTHEYTHILHTDHIEGIPALVNKILGKTLAPNQVQPHWLLEGLAVFEESARTSGGRLRSSMWNMWMRADVLEDNVATLDVFSNVPRRWPQGNIWYLYGSFFMQWIAETYGEQAIRAMIDDYAYQVIPYAINRSIRRATGRTYEELYAAWVDSMQRSFGAQAQRHPRARPSRGNAADPHGQHGRAPALDPGLRLAGARRGPPLLRRRRPHPDGAVGAAARARRERSRRRRAREGPRAHDPRQRAGRVVVHAGRRASPSARATSTTTSSSSTTSSSCPRTRRARADSRAAASAGARAGARSIRAFRPTVVASCSPRTTAGRRT